MVGSCSTAGRYGTALSIYEAADELFLLQTSSSSTYRKIVGFSTSNLATNGKSISYGSGVSSYYYSQDIDADENTGDVYKPASWQAPAKHIRFTFQNVDHLKFLLNPKNVGWAGGYLYMR